MTKGDQMTEVPKEEVAVQAEPKKSKSKKRVRETMTESELREERKAANRKSAFQSRLRKKQLIEELQGKVSKLSEELKTLNEENQVLSYSLQAELAENRRLRFLQMQVMGGGGGGLGAAMQGLNPANLALMAQLQQQQQHHQQQKLQTSDLQHLNLDGNTKEKLLI
mmetsp:Transcript_13848/g.19963  ORF Transcript_13848/g.19963 Transcript_13848/m.19963 type:complete len:166 (+) Transcript_13848:65-562(+)